MPLTDAKGNVHDNRTGQFSPKPEKPRGIVGRRPPAMDQQIDIRSTLDELPATLAESQPLRTGEVKHDYELVDGRRIFVVLPEGENPPKYLDNSTEQTFYEHRLILMQDLGSIEDDDGDMISLGEPRIAVGMMLLTYKPDSSSSERMLGIQMRSRINAGVRLSPIDFGSLDSVYDDMNDLDINYGDCNYNYLVERS